MSIFRGIARLFAAFLAIIDALRRIRNVSFAGRRLEDLSMEHRFPPRSPIARENRYDFLIQDAAIRHGVPAEIIKAVIAAESGFNPDAFRAEPAHGDASRGLMQVLLSTARGLGWSGDPSELFSPAVSIQLGTELLARLRRRFGNWRDALASYNGGTMIRGEDGNLRPELETYIARVEAHAARWGATLPLAAGGAALVVLVAAALWMMRSPPTL